MSEIICNHVKKAYGETIVLHDVSFTIQPHERISIIGGSGSGKTTLLKLLNALILPDEGSIQIDGIDISTMDANLLRQSIGYVIQSIGLFPHMTIYDNITYVLRLKKWDAIRMQQRVEELLHIVDLDATLLTRYPDELSGGQKQRVGIAREMCIRDRFYYDERAYECLFLGKPNRMRIAAQPMPICKSDRWKVWKNKYQTASITLMVLAI